MSLAIKHYKPDSSLGMKKYKPHFNLGIKTYTNHLNHVSNSNNPLAHSKDGVIYNNSNSADSYKEPKKFISSYKPRNYTQEIKHSSIEKAKKKSSNKYENSKFN
jgi:hypothetical protein